MPELKTDEAVEKARDDSVYVIKKSFVDTVFVTLATVFLALFIINLLVNKEVEQTYVAGCAIVNVIYAIVRNYNVDGGMQTLIKLAAVFLILGLAVVELITIIK